MELFKLSVTEEGITGVLFYVRCTLAQLLGIDVISLAVLLPTRLRPV